MKINHLIIAGIVTAASLAPAAVKAEDGKFMRSSIYTILVNSDEQNTRLDKEAVTTDAEGYQASLEEAGLQNLGVIPSLVFPKIAIPEQFNDHNLSTRVLDFDVIAQGITDEEAKAARNQTKNGETGDFLKAILSQFLTPGGPEESSILRIEKVDNYMHAAVQKFLKENKVADFMVAKWYNYDENNTPKFNAGLIQERGLENASAQDLAQAAANDEFKAMLSSQGFELLNNTFLVATNLRFRNNKAVAKEASDMADAAMQILTNSVSNALVRKGLELGIKKGTEALVNGLMKDHYSTTAVTHLYKLKWNDDIDLALSDKVLFNENATLQDLLDAGLCELEFVGSTKARAGVKKDKTKTISELAELATARAIDKAIAKLQVENEVFRTTVPISKSEDGYVYAKIGTKEGLNEGDEYEVLEQQVDSKTNKIGYKKVASAKVEKGGIWFNTSGADDLIANADEKEAAEMKAAQELGYSKLKTGKKNDFSGYYLRLAKKKGKIQD